MVKNKDKKSKSDLDETPKSSQEEKELDKNHLKMKKMKFFRVDKIS